MDNNRMWRFPSNNYGNESGLDTGELEIFKKDPGAALAREICQNSIDAKHGDLKTVVEFKLFEIDREKIPGINELSNEIKKCYDFKKESPKEGKSLELMYKSINRKKIKCLRISDFNTSGLLGVRTNERGKPFYNLTKGSGVSDKSGTTGGSKGIGKFATFVASTTNTNFYSTRTIDKEKGFIGISKLRSVPLDSDDLNLMTTGTGYYSINKKNEPIIEKFNLDPNFEREESEYGTDIYLIGFNDNEGWQNDIIAKTLDSFMVAIMHDVLEVVVDDIKINKNTLPTILDNENIFKNRYKREVKDIKAQYELLSDSENVHIKDLIIGKDNKITLYVKQYKQENEKKANKRCIMVRYPYMKIKHLTGHSYLPYSALCVIHDNELNQLLRNIENPQHNDWEIKRLNDYPEDKKITKEIKREMDNTINECIKEILKQSDSESTDVEGAGEFLPSLDNGDYLGNNIKADKIDVSKPKENKTPNPKTKKAGENEEGYDFDEGSPGGENEGGHSGNGGEKNPEHPKDLGDSGGEGKDLTLKRIPLNGIKFKNIAVDKKRGRFDVVFDSLHDEDNCELKVKMYGEGKDKYPIKIISASINSEECVIDNGKIKNLKIKKGKKYKIECKLNINELFSSEVTLYAYR